MNSGRVGRRRGARVAVRERDPMVPWWAWALVAAGLVAAVPSFAQGTGPNAPGPGAPGPSALGAGAPGARQNGQVQGEAPKGDRVQVEGAKPVPDTGVIVPPSTVGTPVITPPATGTMPVIRPPGSGGGAGGVIAK